MTSQLEMLIPLAIYLFCGLLGIIAHYAKNWAKGEIEGDLFCYLFLDHPKQTLAVFISFLVSAAALLATGSINVNTDPMMLIGSGFGIGWVCDSGFNKGETK